MPAILKGVDTDHILSMQKEVVSLAWNLPFTQQVTTTGDVARDGAYVGEMKTTGQLKFVVQVQEKNWEFK